MASNSSGQITQYFSILPTAFGIIPFIVSCGIIINNTIALVAFKRMKTLRLQHCLMIGLAVADLLTLIPSGTMTVIALNGTVWLSPLACDLIGVAFLTTIGNTTWIHSVMSIEKCISILYPLKHRAFSLKTRAKFVIGVALAVCFIFPVSIPLAILFVENRHIKFAPNVATCLFMSDNMLMASAGLLFIVLPLLIELITHLIIAVTIKNLKSVRKNQALRTFKVLALTVGIYYVCWMPKIIQVTLTNVLGPARMPKWSLFMTLNVIISNSWMSSVIYCVCIRRFRTQLQCGALSVGPRDTSDSGDTPLPFSKVSSESEK